MADKSKKAPDWKKNSMRFESVDIGKIIKGKTTEIMPGKSYDVEGYGTMFGLHIGSDEGRFVFIKMKGDFDISARIESIHNDKLAFTEAGIMVRKDLSPMGLMLGQFVTNNEYHGEADQYTFIHRVKEGFSLKEGQLHDAVGKGTWGNEGFAYSAWGYIKDDQSIRPRPFPNVWIRITRNGNTYTGHYKEGNQPWAKLGDVNVDLGNEPLTGMCITANHHGAGGDTRAVVAFRDLQGF